MIAKGLRHSMCRNTTTKMLQGKIEWTNSKTSGMCNCQSFLLSLDETSTYQENTNRLWKINQRSKHDQRCISKNPAVQFILNYSLERFVQEPEALRTWPFATFEPFSGRVLSECSQDRINDKLFLHSKYLFMLNFMAKCQKSPSHISQPFNALWLSLKIESLYFLTSNLDVRCDGTFPRFQLQPVAIKCIGLRFEAHDNEVMESHEMRV